MIKVTINDLIKIIKLLKPNFHNKITWLLVLFGISLIGTPLIEMIINKIFETHFSISITSDNDTNIGIIIILIALTYNILTNYFNKYLLHKETIKKLGNYLSEDKKLYKILLKELPSNGSINFLRDHDFNYPFRLSELDQLVDFIYNWDNAEHEFIDKDIEKIKTNLFDEIKNYLEYSSMNTYPLKAEFQTVKTDIDSEIELSETTKENISQLNKYGDTIYNLHQELIRNGRESLYI